MKKYPLNQCALYKCGNKRKLEDLLSIPHNGLKLINIEYTSFEINKKDSSEKRQITAPNDGLKLIQRRILNLIKYIERPKWVISGTKGKCYIDNGFYHKNNRYVLTIDIQNFYDNCRREYVYRFFCNKMLNSPDVAKALTDIVTYKGRIPTGCPTSQLIAYYAYEDMFNSINNIANKYDCVFSLYVDDMTFSSKKPFNKDLLEHEIAIELRKFNHKPKCKKVKYYNKHTPKPVTGTIVTTDNKLVVPNNLQEKVFNGFREIQELYSNKRIEELNKKIPVLLGQIQASKNIEGKNKFSEIKRIIKSISKECSSIKSKNLTKT